MKNGFELDYAGSKDLKGIFDAKEEGEDITLTVTLQINQKDENGIKGSIKEVVIEDALEDEDKVVEADEKEPVMVVVRLNSTYVQ